MKRVLLTNDDGVFAAGLLANAKAFAEAGYRVTVCAPDKNWSACGHVKTLSRPMRINRVHLAEGIEAYSTDGAPSDCVALAVMGGLDRDFDLVVSGINPNNNIGIDMTYSGTVTAALEGSLFSKPSFAVSLENSHDPREEQALMQTAAAAVKIISQLLELVPVQEKGKAWNLNFPFKPDGDFSGIRFTSAGNRIYQDRIDKRVDPFGKPYFWIAGEAPTGKAEAGNEWEALQQGYISVCPLQLDLTDHAILESLKGKQLLL